MAAAEDHTAATPKTMKLRLQFTQTHQNWTTEDWRNVACFMSLHFCCNIQMAKSKFGVKDMKTSSCLVSTIQASAGSVMV